MEGVKYNDNKHKNFHGVVCHAGRVGWLYMARFKIRRENKTMKDQEMMELLMKIHDVCAERAHCEGCKFNTSFGCSLKGIPDKWQLDLLYANTMLRMGGNNGD